MNKSQREELLDQLGRLLKLRLPEMTFTGLGDFYKRNWEHPVSVGEGFWSEAFNAMRLRRFLEKRLAPILDQKVIPTFPLQEEYDQRERPADYLLMGITPNVHLPLHKQEYDNYKVRLSAWEKANICDRCNASGIIPPSPKDDCANCYGTGYYNACIADVAYVTCECQEIGAGECSSCAGHGYRNYETKPQEVSQPQKDALVSMRVLPVTLDLLITRA